MPNQGILKSGKHMQPHPKNTKLQSEIHNHQNIPKYGYGFSYNTRQQQHT